MKLIAFIGGVMGGMDWWNFPDRADFRRLLGPRDANAARWRDYSVLAEANRLKNGGQRIFLTVGARDFFLAPNRALHARLDARGVRHTYVEVAGDDVELTSHKRRAAYAGILRALDFFAEGMNKGR